MSSMAIILRIMKTAIFRFCVVGLFGSSLNYLVFLFCHFSMGIEYQLAGIFGFLAPIPIVFAINREWSFQSDVKKITALPLYFCTNGVALVGHFVVQTISHEIFGMQVRMSQIMGIFATALINFYLAKTLVFKHREFPRE